MLIEEVRKRNVFFIMDCMLCPEFFKILKQCADERCIYTTPLRDLAPMGEVAMLAGRRDDGLVVLALFEKPENLVLILWFLSSDAN